MLPSQHVPPRVAVRRQRGVVVKSVGIVRENKLEIPTMPYMLVALDKLEREKEQSTLSPQDKMVIDTPELGSQ